MAERFTRQAAKDVNSTYKGGAQVIKPNISATQKLFNNLVASTGEAADSMVGDITADAYARGVGRGSLAQDVAGGFTQTVDEISAALAADKASQLADLRVAMGDLGVGKATAVNDIANVRQDTSLANRQFQQDKIAQDRNQELTVRRHNLVEAERAAREAASRAASQKSLLDMSKTDIDRMLRLSLNSVTGEDGYVRPEDLAKAYNDYQRAGFSREDFWREYQGYWNPNQTEANGQPEYSDEFYYFVGKGV